MQSDCGEPNSRLHSLHDQGVYRDQCGRDEVLGAGGASLSKIAGSAARPIRVSALCQGVATGRPRASSQGDMVSAAQAGTAVAPGRLVEVSEDVFAYLQSDGSWGINNTGVLVGRGGVLAIDACSTERRTRHLLDVIRQVSDQPVRTLVNTHHHGDHAHGNYLFGGATVVGHERTREEILRVGLALPNRELWEPVEWGALEFAPPFLTFRDGVTLWADDLRCEVRHVGTVAHSSNDSYVWLPDRSLLFCGDLVFSGGTPYVAMGSVTGSIEVLEEVVRPLGARTLVPGHGEVCGPEVLDTVLAYLRFVQRTAERGHAAGRSPLDVAQDTDLGEFAGLTASE